jgi:hypothetical protein
MVKEKGKFSTHHQGKGAFFFKVATDDQHTVKKRLAIFPFPAGMSLTKFSLARLGNFQQKNNSTEDGIDVTHCYFRRNSSCSAK